MNKINKINQWLKNRNDLENIILSIAAIALGVGGTVFYLSSKRRPSALPTG